MDKTCSHCLKRPHVASVNNLFFNFSIHSPAVGNTRLEIFRQVIHIAIVGDLRLMLGWLWCRFGNIRLVCTKVHMVSGYAIGVQPHDSIPIGLIKKEQSNSKIYTNYFIKIICTSLSHTFIPFVHPIFIASSVSCEVMWASEMFCKQSLFYEITVFEFSSNWKYKNKKAKIEESTFKLILP